MFRRKVTNGLADARSVRLVNVVTWQSLEVRRQEKITSIPDFGLGQPEVHNAARVRDETISNAHNCDFAALERAFYITLEMRKWKITAEEDQ
jgi:hypothetical protein